MLVITTTRQFAEMESNHLVFFITFSQPASGFLPSHQSNSFNLWQTEGSEKIEAPSYSEEVEDSHAEGTDSSVVPLDGGQIGEHPHLQRKLEQVGKRYDRNKIGSGLAMFIMMMID